MSSKRKRTYTPTYPLPPATLLPLTMVYRARGLTERTLSSAIGTTHPHVGRIMAGKSRPSVVLAQRIGIALDLPPEFTALMMSQSSTVGRKMRHPDGFDRTALAGADPCPVILARSRELMRQALDVAGQFDLGREFEVSYRLWSVGLVPAMGTPEAVVGGALDPWGEFNDGFDIDPLIVWDGSPKPPHGLPAADLPEFIVSIDRESVVRCSHHA